MISRRSRNRLREAHDAGVRAGLTGEPVFCGYPGEPFNWAYNAGFTEGRDQRRRIAERLKRDGDVDAAVKAVIEGGAR